MPSLLDRPISQVCECLGFCNKDVKIPLKVVTEIQKAGNLFIIVHGCLIGPGPNDQLIEEREGYNLYKELPPQFAD